MNYIVYEIDYSMNETDDIYKQISIPLTSLEDAKSFVLTMKEGRYYKSMRPELELVIQASNEDLNINERVMYDKFKEDMPIWKDVVIVSILLRILT